MLHRCPAGATPRMSVSAVLGGREGPGPCPRARGRTGSAWADPPWASARGPCWSRGSWVSGEGLGGQRGAVQVGGCWKRSWSVRDWADPTGVARCWAPLETPMWGRWSYCFETCMDSQQFEEDLDGDYGVSSFTEKPIKRM